MPANKKYLAQSPWVKFGKLSAAFLGSLLASISTHLALAVWIDRSVVVPTAAYTGFFMWVALMIITYWLPRPGQAWLLMVGIVLVSAIAIYWKG